MKKFKINGISVKADSIADAIHQVKDVYVKDYTHCPNYPSRSMTHPEIILDTIDSINELDNYAKQHPDQLDKVKTQKDRRIKQLDEYIEHYSKECKEYETFADDYSKYMSYVRGLRHDLKRTGKLDSLDSINDSPASEIAREIKAKYPQVKIKQETRKTHYGNGHKTELSFSNYPGEGYTYSSTDPRKKQWENWIKFLEYLYVKYTHDNKSYNIRWNVSSDTLHIFDPPLDEIIDAVYQVKDSAASDIVKEIKAKYPQVKIRQTSKPYKSHWGGYHKTTLSFSNYPGEGYDFYNKYDPRKKEWEHWQKFLEYLYVKYTHDNSDTGILNHVGAHELEIITSIKDSLDDSVNDSI